MTCKAVCDWAVSLIDRPDQPMSDVFIYQRRAVGQTLSRQMSRARVVDLCKVTEIPANLFKY